MSALNKTEAQVATNSERPTISLLNEPDGLYLKLNDYRSVLVRTRDGIAKDALKVNKDVGLLLTLLNSQIEELDRYNARHRG